MSEVDSIRFATFNASLNRNSEGQLITDLSTPNNTQARTVAEIIQRNNPDVLLVNEFDFDAGGEAAQLFQENYLSVGQNGANPVEYPYFYVAPSNTGIASGFDLNNNGTVVTTPGAPGYGDDALGFGNFPGQYGMVIYSKYPIDTENVRTFQNFLWQDMPGALLPDNLNTPEANDWYSPEELEVFRLSSKSHWDIPVEINGETVHVLTSHPTPPTFDGPEDRNGTRNHDEIRFWSDYITPGEGSYIYDDAGDYGGLAPGSSFVIMGDQNADPNDGDSVDNAIQQLLDNPLINTSITPSSEGAPEQAALQGGANTTHLTDPAFDTADFADGAPGNLRVDYVLPSQNLEITDAAVFWPKSTEPQFPLVGTFSPSIPGGFPSSDHRLVRVDVTSEASISDFNRQSVSGVEFIGEVTFPTGFTFEGTQVGGLSGIAYDRFNNVFYSISDDRSQFNPARYYTLSIDLNDGRLDTGDVQFQNVTTITDENGQPFAPNSLDPEGIAFSERGTLFISSEGERSTTRLIDPFINEFSLQGQQFNELPVPDKFNPAGIGENDPGIRNNLAFESLTISPNQRFLFTATENALVQDGPTATLINGSPSRILQYDLQTGEVVGEFLYITDPVADAPNPAGSFNTNGLVELLALDNNGTFLSLERSFSTGVGNSVKLYETSILGATDISDLDSVNAANVDAVAQKRLLLDFGDLGITLDNLEGIALGPTLEDGRQSLIVVADNNFSSTQFTQILSFALDVDTITGAAPVVGGDANDSLYGDNANDTIQGRGGNDQIFGGEGVNTLFGDGGDDLIYGGSQADTVTGGTGNDTIYTSEGNNTVFGSAGNDIIYSGSGSDEIDGGTGNDTIWLGGGQDTIVLARGNGVDTINNVQLGQTQIRLSGGLTFDDLAIAQADGATLISTGNELLASLSWVQASSISASNFVTV
jgi:3-phytase/alkaline phosphatase D